MEDLSQFCAPGTVFKQEMIPVADNVSLKVIAFTPPQKTDSPPVVFVPGWITLMSAWKIVLQEMTKDFPIYYIETREKVSSQVKGTAEYGVEDIGKDIVQLIKHFNLKDNHYILLGSSLGASALLDCCRFLDRSPFCLVLIGPNAVFRVPRFGKIVIYFLPPRLFLLVKPLVKWYLKTFRLDIKSDYEQYEKYCGNIDSADPWKLKKAIMKLWNWQAWDLLPGIQNPVVIFGASKDSLHEPENLKQMAAMLPNAEIIDLETNKGTHSTGMVEAMRNYVTKLFTEK